MSMTHSKKPEQREGQAQMEVFGQSLKLIFNFYFYLKGSVYVNLNIIGCLKG